MATWFVTGDGDEALAVVESLGDGRISIAVHSSEPLSVRSAEELRAAIGAAIGDAQGGVPL